MSKAIGSFVSSRAVLGCFDAERRFVLSLSICVRAVVRRGVRDSRSVLTCPLMQGVGSAGRNMRVVRSCGTLRLCLRPCRRVAVLGDFVGTIFIGTLDGCGLGTSVLCSLLARGSLCDYAPRSLGTALKVGCAGSVLGVQVLSPIRDAVRGLCRGNRLPFCVDVAMRGSLFKDKKGVVKIGFRAGGRLTMLQLTELHPYRVRFVASGLVRLLPFSCPFLRRKVGRLGSGTMSAVFRVVGSVRLSPSCNGVRASALVGCGLGRRCRVDIPQFGWLVGGCGERGGAEVCAGTASFILYPFG